MSEQCGLFKGIYVISHLPWFLHLVTQLWSFWDGGSTSLAGVMARHYALRDGIPEEVAGSFFNVVNLVPTCLRILFPFCLSK